MSLLGASADVSGCVGAVEVLQLRRILLDGFVMAANDDDDDGG